MIVSDDATIWSVTYDRHNDDLNSFIMQATDVLFSGWSFCEKVNPII
jgi:hypothetical protein